MTEKDIQKILTEFKRLSPRKEFINASKMRIFSIVPDEKPQALFMGTNPVFLRTSMNSLTFVFASIVIIMGAYLATQELSPLFLPGLNQKKISAEAEMIGKQIDIQLSQISYFQKTSEESADALKEITSKNLDHLNETLIQHEAQTVQKTSDPEQKVQAHETITNEVNELLQEVSK